MRAQHDDENDNDYREYQRMYIAIRMMAAIRQRSENWGMSGSESVAKQAVMDADALIKELNR